MSAIPALQPTPPGSATNGITRRERQRWTAGVVIAFLLGLLLAGYLPHRSTPNCRTSLPDEGPRQKMSGDAGSPGAPDKGSGAKLGAPGEGDASRKPGTGSTTAEGGGGGGGKGGGGDGDLGHGNPWKANGDDYTGNGGASHAQADQAGGSDGSRDMKGAGGDDGKVSPPQELHAQQPQQGTGTPPPAQAGELAGSDASPAQSAPLSPGTPAPEALTANDLRYDKSELPRYPNAVAQSASGTAALTGPKPADPNMSVSAIMTRDDLPTVAAWYHEHLPGWTEQNLGQMAMFWPPDRKADPRTVWLVVDPKTGQTGAVLWKAKKKEP